MLRSETAVIADDFSVELTAVLEYRPRFAAVKEQKLSYSGGERSAESARENSEEFKICNRALLKYPDG